MPYRMGDLADQSSYDPFAAEQFVNPAVDAMGRGLAQTVMAPGQLMQPNPYQPGGAQASDPYASELASWYDDQRDKGAVDWGRDTAMQMAGPGLAVGAPVKAGEAVLGAGPIRAYHSSPYDFDKFKMSKIGKGEGEQVYGHGLYFSENPKVSGQGGEYWKSFLDRFPAHEHEAAVAYRKAGFDREKAAAAVDADMVRLRTSLETGSSDNFRTARIQGMLKEREDALNLLRGGGPVGPRTYEVNIKADPAQMLQWDRPLTEQPHVISAAERNAKFPALDDAQTGREFHREFVNDIYGGSGMNLKRAQAYVSSAMKDEGIPGIKYLDAGSRGAGTGSSNYVVFNPAIIDIMKKYGIAGLAPAGMGALAAQDAYQPDERM
jgi:hypothetical protein